MDQSIITIPRSPAARVGRVLIWLSGIVCCVFLLSVIVLIARQIIIPPPAQRILLVGSIPLPEAIKAQGAPDSLAPGQSQNFDGFDFQAIDPQTHLLFIVHSGVNPDKANTVNPKFTPETDSKTDGNVVVFDLRQNKVVHLLDIPHGAGVIAAPDLGKVFIGDAIDGDRPRPEDSVQVGAKKRGRRRAHGCSSLRNSYCACLLLRISYRPS